MYSKFSYKKVLCILTISTLVSLTTYVNAGVIPYKNIANISTTSNIAKRSESKRSESKEDEAITRTRQQVLMLDDLYKTAVVLITEHYVKDPSILSAASAAKAIFATMKKKGWHEVRLVGLTDELTNPSENAPKDAFEKQSKKHILNGKSSHEAIINKNGKRFLRFATAVPVVMKQCIMCHANFEGNDGAIGALSYLVPVIE